MGGNCKYACAWCGARARACQETAAIFYRPTANGGRARGESDNGRKSLSRGHLSLNHIFLPAPLATRQPLESGVFPGKARAMEGEDCDTEDYKKRRAEFVEKVFRFHERRG